MWVRLEVQLRTSYVLSSRVQGGAWAAHRVLRLFALLPGELDCARATRGASAGLLFAAVLVAARRAARRAAHAQRSAPRLREGFVAVLVRGAVERALDPADAVPVALLRAPACARQPTEDQDECHRASQHTHFNKFIVVRS